MPRPKGSKNKPKDPTMPTKTATKPETVADQATSKGEVAIFSPPRLPYHPAVEERFGIDKGTWKVLVEAIFPAAKTVDAIAMALSYCKSRGLDVMKRPVHIVPMWDSARGAMVETVWPGISELRTTASRTNGYAGCDVAEFGETITMDFKGRVKRKDGWVEEAITGLEFPEWCRITVYRVVAGQRCKFVGPKVAWLETYATQGNSELPNKMWQERPEGQLEKCAEAAALRRAFPEEIGNELTAEEMTGRSVHDLAVDIPAITDQAAAAGARDTAPPRQASTAPEPGPGEDHAAGEVQDGAPPRRAPKPAAPKEDPISSGPQRAAPKDAAKTVAPYKIPGEGHTYESWAAKYVDNLKTSPDMATLYGWLDKNADPLARLNKGKPSVYAGVKKETEHLQQTFRDAADKTKGKADKAAAKKAPPPSDMDEPSHDELTGGADGPDEPPTDHGKPADDNPETIIKWAKEQFATVTDPDALEEFYTRVIEPHTQGMFPPDQEEIMGEYRLTERRLGAD